MNAIEAAREIINLDEELFEVSGGTQEEDKLQHEFEIMCASHGAQIAEALLAMRSQQNRILSIAADGDNYESTDWFTALREIEEILTTGGKS